MGMFLRRGTAPSLGTPIGDLDVGSIVKLNVDGTPWEFLVVHQGLPSSMYDASCDGTWLLMKDIYENRQWNSSNVNIYETSTINTYLNSEFVAKFDSNIQSAIKQVKIPYRSGGGKGGTNQSGANGLPTKVFFLSGYEVGWTTSNSSYFPVDGAKLDYFTAGSAGNSKRIAVLNGSATYYFYRSPNVTNTASVLITIANGGYGNGDAANPKGIRPAFILPSSFRVTDDMLA